MAFLCWSSGFSYIGLVSWYSITGKNSNIEVAALCVSITTGTTLVTMRFRGLHEEGEEEDDAGFIEEIRSPRNNGLSPDGPLSKVASDADLAAGPKVTNNLDDLVLPGPKLIQQSAPPTTAVHVERLLFTEKSVEIEVAAEARQAVRLKPAPPPQSPQETKNVAMSTEEDAAYQACPVVNFFPSGCRAACCSLTPEDQPARSR